MLRQSLDPRAQRGVQQRILIQNIELGGHPGECIVSVLGSTGSLYTVVVSPTELSCTCMDFTTRQKRCKHIYHVVGRAAQLPESEWFREPSAEFASIITDTLARRGIHAIPDQVHPSVNQTSHQVHPTVQQRPWVGESCGICLEPMEETEPVVYCQKQCGQSVHRECCKRIREYARKHNKSLVCPYCRTAFDV